MRLLLLVVTLAIGGCGGASVGQSCHADAECQPLICNAPFVGPNEPPAAGTCQQPSPLGGLCHRQVECADALICVLPAGGTPYSGGTCQK